MPVVPEPHAPPPTTPGLVWSQPSAMAQVTVQIPCGIWWLVVPDRPDLNLEVIVLPPIMSMLPGGIRASASHSYEAALPQTINEVLGSKYPVVVEALETKSESQSLYALFRGQAAYDAFVEVWNMLGTVLLQSDSTRQWSVNLGKTRKVSEIQSEDPSFTTMFVVSLDVREVAPV